MSQYSSSYLTGFDAALVLLETRKPQAVYNFMSLVEPHWGQPHLHDWQQGYVDACVGAGAIDTQNISK